MSDKEKELVAAVDNNFYVFREGRLVIIFYDGGWCWWNNPDPYAQLSYWIVPGTLDLED